MLFKILLLASISLSTTLQVGSIALRRLTKSPKMQVAHVDDVAAKSSWLEKQQDMVGAVKPTGTASTSATMNDEAAAKTAWLAKQEMPQWGKPSEAAAKAAWLAKSEELFTASWGQSTKTSAETSSLAVMPEAEAKAAWLAKSEEVFKASWKIVDEAEAEVAELAKQEVPKWGGKSEEVAKAAWLAKSEKLFTASWGKSTKTFAAAQTGSPGVMPIDEASAKAAWLAKSEELFKASWGRK